MNKKTMESIRSSRSIHLIDIENLCGAANPTVEQVRSVRQEYLALVHPGELDQYYITVSSKNNLEAVMFGWPGARIECNEGHDGADILLAKEMLEQPLTEAFGQVYLASGDGGLAPFASRLATKGAEVSVISKARCLSHLMRQIGAEVIYLQDEYGLAA